MKTALKSWMFAATAAISSVAFGEAIAATSVTSHDVGTVVSALQENGYQAKLDKDANGNPIIFSGVGGSRFLLSFSSCVSAMDCSYIELIASWREVKENAAKSVLSEWSENYSGAVYASKDSSLSVYHYLITGKDGISAQALIENINYFMKDFAQIGDLLVKAN